MPRDVEQPQYEDHGVGATTHVEKLRARWAERLHAAIPPGERWGDMHEQSQEEISGQDSLRWCGSHELNLATRSPQSSSSMISWIDEGRSK